MKVGFYQFDIIHKNKKANIAKVVESLTGKEFDLIVLPELFSTGYLFDFKEEVLTFAEELPEGDTTHSLEKITNEKNCYIVGSIPEIEDGKIYNTAFVIGPNGYMGKQRKLHLSKLEQKFFSSGSKIRTFDLNGTRIGIVTCFDSWFPEISRILSLNGAQILCQPANFGDEKTLGIIRTRAIENIVFTITSNRIGEETNKDINAAFRGESQIIGPSGQVIAKADKNENLTIIDIDVKEAKLKDNFMSNFKEEWKKYEIKSQNNFSIG
ncbi:nitrilase-related carbon-nitrogen hydrolase [Bacteroidota bacterium]